MGFLHRKGGIGEDTSHNALKWVPSMYNSFDHFPKRRIIADKFSRTKKRLAWHPVKRGKRTC